MLMFGMETMGTQSGAACHDPAFMRLFSMFQNPLQGLAAGAVLAQSRSSSASVGILQALAAQAPWAGARLCPIIMGQNIGTYVTALLSSVGAQLAPNCAAVAFVLQCHRHGHLLWRAFYGLNALVRFSFMGQAVNAASIAVVHSVFNVFAALNLLPFSKVLEACLPHRAAHPGGEAAAARPRALRSAWTSAFCKAPASRWSSAVWLRAIWPPAPKRRWSLHNGGLLSRYDEEKAAQM